MTPQGSPAIRWMAARRGQPSFSPVSYTHLALQKLASRGSCTFTVANFNMYVNLPHDLTGS